MRAIWKGAIAFGLVNVPVKVYSATEDHDISLHQVHNADGGRIRYQRRCEVCSEIIDYEDIDKAYEEDGRTVILSREELKSIPAENSHEIEVVQFVPAEQLDPMTFEKSYYLEPDAKSPKAYVLLRRALEDTDRVAIVQFALREKTRLGALRIRGDVLVLQGLLWADEVREASFPALETSVRISAQEREMSAALVDSMAADFDPEQFTDDYQIRLPQPRRPGPRRPRQPRRPRPGARPRPLPKRRPSRPQRPPPAVPGRGPRRQPRRPSPSPPRRPPPRRPLPPRPRPPRRRARAPEPASGVSAGGAAIGSGVPQSGDQFALLLVRIALEADLPGLVLELGNGPVLVVAGLAAFAAHGGPAPLGRGVGNPGCLLL